MLMTENANDKGSGKGNANKDSGQGTSKGNGKHQGGKAKVDKEPLTASWTRTRMQTPILRQAGILSPLVGNQTRALRPVPRRKPNKNKGLSMPTKMGTSLTPANAPVSCTLRGIFRRRGLK